MSVEKRLHEFAKKVIHFIKKGNQTIKTKRDFQP